MPVVLSNAILGSVTPRGEASYVENGTAKQALALSGLTANARRFP